MSSENQSPEKFALFLTSHQKAQFSLNQFFSSEFISKDCSRALTVREQLTHESE